ACYEVSVVLISSTQEGRTPLPVLTRGERDSGVVAQADIVPPFPTLETAALRNGEPAALPGDELTLTGHHLLGASAVSFAHPRVAVPPAPPTSVSDTEIKVPVPAIAAGVCVVAAMFGAPERTSNGLPLALAPRVTAGLPAAVSPNPNGAITLDLTCDPPVVPGQAVFLLIG